MFIFSEVGLCLQTTNGMLKTDKSISLNINIFWMHRWLNGKSKIYAPRIFNQFDFNEIPANIQSQIYWMIDNV